MEMKQVLDAPVWNDTLECLPIQHVLQTWEWGAFKERHGWQAERWLWTASGVPKAAALMLHRSVPGLPGPVMYVPKGPLLDYGDAALLARVLSDLEELGRGRRALFLKLDPDLQIDTPQGEAAVALMRQRGWRFSREQVQFVNTLMLDLSPSLDELLRGMKSKWRYNVRLAARRGVVVRPGGVEDLSLLYDMYRETSLRDRFVIRPEAYYQDAWGAFISARLAQPLIAEVEGQPVAMLILFQFGKRAWYMYGASRSVHRERMPNHLLQWEAIRWAKERGCTAYDLWGAPRKLDPSDPMWGVHRFKQGFGAHLVRFVGAYDYPVSRPGYWLYAVAAPRVLALMRWRHWRMQRAE
jgi:peptidoglycan pentaglycine glycine transferase (the first glycine)